MKRPADSALSTDLYQLTMLQAYFLEDMTDSASFELFVRKLPSGRNFLLAVGLEQMLGFLESFHFTEDECAWLRNCGRFRPEFIDHLADLRFTGSAEALPEGTVFFPDEPVLRVTAPLPQAQVVETRLINLFQFQTMIASKAVRAVLAAPGKLLLDFGLRRAHGAEAGLLAARASYIAGFDGTSNVLAGAEFDIPVYGTMAHSYVMAHDDELDAFKRFAAAQPDDLVLLIDTYDTERCAEKVVALARAFGGAGPRIKGVRLDSGDLAQLAFRVREILDRGGLGDTMIFASGDLDECNLRRLLARGAPIDGFGIGTRMITSADAPFLNCAYKLQEYAGVPRFKMSPGKKTRPGCKQVFRYYDGEGRFHRDLITVKEDMRDAEPLLQPVMRGGRRLFPAEAVCAARRRVAEQLARLPENLKSNGLTEAYRVDISEALTRLADDTARRFLDAQPCGS